MVAAKQAKQGEKDPDSKAGAGNAVSAPGDARGMPRLARLSIAAVLAIVALQVTVFVVVHMCKTPPVVAKVPVAIAVAAFGVVILAAIDLWLRPRREQDGLLTVRRYMALWALLPFIIGLMTSAWLQRDTWRHGLDDIRELANEMNADPGLRPCGVVTSQGVERAVHDAVVHHFPAKGAFAANPDQANPETGSPGGQAASPATQRANSDTADGDDRADEERRFIELARVVGHDLQRADEWWLGRRLHGSCDVQDDASKQCFPASCRDVVAAELVAREAGQHPVVDRLVRYAHKDTKFYCVLGFAMQSLFVLWIPCLLVVSIAKADGRLRGVKLIGLDSSGELHRCVLDKERDIHILGEDHALFIPRLCFAALLLLGTTYVFAPFGLKTSYTMSLVEAHALPGHTSFVLWCNHFASAPVITVGFVGFLIYALITATQRFAQDDFDDVAQFSLLIRGLTVILLSLALSAAESSLGDVSPRLFVFIAGVFPVRALAAIAKRANISIDPEFETDDARSFACIPSLDPTKVFALRAAGIQSTYDLASVPIVDIIGRVRIDPRLLGRAVDRAILVDAVGDKLADQLEPCAITCASELVDAFFDDSGVLRAEPPKGMSEGLIVAARRAAERLHGDARLAELDACLNPMPGKVVEQVVEPTE